MIAQSLAEGPAGAVLLALEQGNDPRPHLSELVAEPVMAHPADASLFEGAPAVAFALACVDTHPTLAGRVEPALAALDQHVHTTTRARLDAAHRRIDRAELPVKSEFDLMAGVTGLGAYLLRRGSEHDELLRDVLAYLVRLTEQRADGLPGWWAVDGPTGPDPRWTDGHGNLSMSHGICGPLTLLALALRRGIAVDGHTDAMRRICHWLDQWQVGDPPNVCWAATISLAQHELGRPRLRGPLRPSWCYGTPGIARAQQLAGLAMSDPARQHLAEQALLWCATDEAQLAQLGDASLCHGWAGLLHTVARAGAHHDGIRDTVPRLLDRLATVLRQRAPNAPGLLLGAAGALLAQYSATTGAPPVTRWDACLLLND